MLLEPCQSWLFSCNSTALLYFILYIQYQPSSGQCFHKLHIWTFSAANISPLLTKICCTKVCVFYKRCDLVTCLTLNPWPRLQHWRFTECCLQISNSVGILGQQIKYRALLSTSLQLLGKNFEVLQMADGVHTMKNTISFTQNCGKKCHTKVRTSLRNRDRVLQISALWMRKWSDSVEHERQVFLHQHWNKHMINVTYLLPPLANWVTFRFSFD